MQTITLETLQHLHSAGLVSRRAVRNYKMISDYNAELCTGVGSVQAIIDISDKYNISYDSAKKVIYKLRNKIR